MNSSKIEWEFAHALNAMLVDLKILAYDKSRGTIFVDALGKYAEILEGLGSFQNFLRVAGEKWKMPSFLATVEFLSFVQEALYEDVACFQTPKPSYMDSIASWKHYETFRMLKEMNVQHTDEFELVRRCYTFFQNKKKRDPNVSVADPLQFPWLSTNYAHVMANHMTLVERIQALENVVYAAKK